MLHVSEQKRNYNKAAPQKTKQVHQAALVYTAVVTVFRRMAPADVPIHAP